MNKILDTLLRILDGFESGVWWLARHAVNVAMAVALLAFATYWAVATAYLIGSNR